MLIIVIFNVNQFLGLFQLCKGSFLLVRDYVRICIIFLIFNLSSYTMCKQNNDYKTRKERRH